MSLFEENAAILQDLENKRGNFDLLRSIDFSHVFPDQASAEAFARQAERVGFSITTIERVDLEADSWDVTASKEMPPSCENITDSEERLEAIARSHGGRADGWGFLGA